ARVMKQAVAHLLPFIEGEKGDKPEAKGKILMATVKGAAHDIGKNTVGAGRGCNGYDIYDCGEMVPADTDRQHDIAAKGERVGLVLGCNCYDILDLGVMVPADRNLKTAIEEKCDIIGLSGLITPSLDGMVHVAREMQRQGFNLPLMIGGATTSKAHTAVKIDPHYTNDAVVYVTDASRAVGVATTLLSKELKPAYVKDIRDEYAMIRERTANRARRTERLSYEQALAAKPQFDWSQYRPVQPSFT